MDRVRQTIIVISAAVTVLAVTAVLMLVPAKRESQTSDEAVYLTSGLSYWKTGDFRLNNEHPPLLKELLSLPLLWRGARFAPAAPDWNGASQWDVAPKVLFENVVPGQELLFLGRTVNVLLTLGLIVFAAAWSRKLWGWRGAALTFGLMAFEPNVLANGHLATTDIGYTLAVLGSVFTFVRFLEHPAKWKLLLAAGVFGLALLTRFNAVVLVVLLLLVFVAVRSKRPWSASVRWRSVLIAVGVFGMVSFMLIWAAYGFEVRPLTGVQDQAAIEVLRGNPSVVNVLARTPLPAMSFLSGFLKQYLHNAGGQWAYLFGRVADHGWWYYFPAAMLVKMTFASMLLAALGTVAALRARGVRSSPWWRALGLALIVLTATAMLSHLNIGVRYVLPSITLLTVLAGGAATLLSQRQWGRALVVVLVLGHIFSAVRYWPHLLPYANEAFGGPRQLHQYLIDANLDWGQDLPLVREYLAKRGITDYRFQSFTTAPAQPYGLVEKPVPTDQEVASAPFRGVIVIGVSILYYPTTQYEWLKRLQPTAVLGDSIYVYDLR